MNSDKQIILNWLLRVQKIAPPLYALFKVKYPSIIEALSDNRLGFDIDWGGIAKTAVAFVTTALPIYQQQQQFKQELALAKLQVTAPAQYQAVAANTPTPQYQAVAVPPSTPNSATVKTTQTGEQVLEIRIDKGQVEQVRAETPKSFDLKEYLPYISIGLILLNMARQ